MTGADRKAIEAALAALTERNDGRLTPDAVVEAARDPASPLHSQFEWDDRKAAGQHRVEQARQLIRSVRVVITNATTILDAPFYVRDPEATGDEQGYVETKRLIGETELARAALVQEFARAEHIYRRARVLAQALGLEDDVGRLMDGLAELRQRVGSLGGQSARAN